MLTSKQKRRYTVQMARRRDHPLHYNFPVAMRLNTSTPTIIRKLDPFFSSLPTDVWELIRGFTLGGRDHPYARNYATIIVTAIRGFLARLELLYVRLSTPAFIRRRRFLSSVRGEYMRRIRFPESDDDYIGPWRIGDARIGGPNATQHLINATY